MAKSKHHQQENQKVTYLLIILLVLVIVFIFLNRIKYDNDKIADEVVKKQTISVDNEGLVDGGIIELEIEPAKVACLLNSLNGCFVANNELFPFSIRGFYFREGTQYNIRVREDIKDGGSKIYYLEEVLSEKKSTVKEIKEVREKFGDYSKEEILGFNLPELEIDSDIFDGVGIEVPFDVDIVEEEIKNDYINNDKIGTSEVVNLTVDSDYIACGDFKCLVVNGDVFYGIIEGFEYIMGYEYTLEVKRTFLDRTSVAIGNYRYELLEIVSQKEV